jgi:hypothetical protein
MSSSAAGNWAMADGASAKETTKDVTKRKVDLNIL